MLHILMNSPFKNNNINRFSKMIDFFDDFLAIQDGVIISLKNNYFIKLIKSLTKNLYVLEEDLLARGFRKNISSIFFVINYEQFVFLTVKNKKQISW
ncbi:sulfurtransferase complex subunit TusB [Buchnera aphidicola]|uniref:sulfurtransferase complex subunit TusB n=1 Tax=Buchnera aphidicola TaxID=9 RepID=UPI0031B84A2A